MEEPMGEPMGETRGEEELLSLVADRAAVALLAELLARLRIVEGTVAALVADAALAAKFRPRKESTDAGRHQ